LDSGNSPETSSVQRPVSNVQHVTARLAAMLALLLARTLPAQGTASLVVTVRDSASGGPVRAAEVVLRGHRAPAVRTDSVGEARFGAVVAGRVIVVARRFGFLPDSQRVTITGGGTQRVELRLATSVHVLDTAMVEAEALRGKMLEFERRRAAGHGTFVTRDDIEARRPIELRDLLRRVPGVTFVDDGSGRPALRFTRASVRPDRDCPPEYWLDGQRVPGFTIDDIVPEDVQGIELYRGPSETPAPFLTRSAGCGVVAIWSRDPGVIKRN
jgi:hypothetical protein